MKNSLRSLLAACALAAVSVSTATAVEPGYVDFGKLVSSAKGQKVEITLGKGLLKFASFIAGRHDPDAGALIAGLNTVRVNVLGLDDSNREAVASHVRTVRERLTGDGWQRIVAVQGKREEDVAIFVKQVGEETVDGLVVTVVDDRKKEAVLINITGQIKAEQIAAVGEHLKIEHLQHRAKKADKI